MTLATDEMLHRLGAGDAIADLCATAGMSRDEFDVWWKAETQSRVPKMSTEPAANVRINRDASGIPHISTENSADLFFGFGYAMAEDRLFQLDYLRRKGHGRLAEILGADTVESDMVARTIGLPHIAAAEWERLPDETRSVLTAFAAGINAFIDNCGDKLPIEFGLLDYRPEGWSEIDSLVIESEFRWYLTGRFPVIVIPELVKRKLGDGPLFEEFVLGEADEEAILPPGSYPAAQSGKQEVGAAMGTPFDAHGSNNWVISGKKSATGAPVVCSDPHIAFEAVSCWYEAHLSGGGYNVAGMAYAGMPAIMFGRTEGVAWGCTNNICSQRDLYQEQTDADHPGSFLYDGAWEPAREVEEVIEVKGSEPIQTTVRFSRNGPIVDDILPAPARNTGPVSIRWLGRHEGGWLTALLAMDRAQSVEEFCEATRAWHVPTFCPLAADTGGHIGYIATGRIPLRNSEERGYRPGWDPDHQWQGLVPFEGMPKLVDPERGWICTANNRVAPPDFPYPLYGRWSSGYRARRIRTVLESQETFTVDEMKDLHRDTLNLRAVESVPKLLAVLEPSDDARVQEAAKHLRDWDCRIEPEQTGPTIFNVFWTHWTAAVTAERFDGEEAELIAAAAGGVASRLLEADRGGWFQKTDRETAIRNAFSAALDALSTEYGSDIAKWTWSKRHRMPLLHVLGGRGDLGVLLNHGGAAAPGDMTTVCNSGYGENGRAATGAGYRLIAELSSPAVLLAQDAQSQSGHPGSPHYNDQHAAWLNKQYHVLPLES